MKTLICLLIFPFSVLAQTHGAETLKTMGKIVDVDLRALDVVMSSPDKRDCEAEEECYVISNSIAKNLTASGGITPIPRSNDSIVCGMISFAPGTNPQEIVKLMAKQETGGWENSEIITIQDSDNGNFRFKASKFAKQGGLGVQLRMNEGTSISVGGGPKNVGVSTKLKFP